MVCEVSKAVVGNGGPSSGHCFLHDGFVRFKWSRWSSQGHLKQRLFFVDD
jgi:hypothetical protein